MFAAMTLVVSVTVFCLLPDPHAELQLWGQHQRPAVAVLADSAVGDWRSCRSAD